MGEGGGSELDDIQSLVIFIILMLIFSWTAVRAGDTPEGRLFVTTVQQRRKIKMKFCP